MPICLLNVSHKIVRNILAVRMGLLIDGLKSQTTFIKDRYVMEGVVLLHETIHEFQSKKNHAVLLKIYFENTYDK